MDLEPQHFVPVLKPKIDGTLPHPQWFCRLILELMTRVVCKVSMQVEGFVWFDRVFNRLFLLTTFLSYQISFSRLRSFVWFLVWKVSWPPPAATKSSALASGTSTMPWNNWAWRVTVRQGRKSLGGNVELAYLVSKMPVWILTLAQVDQYIEPCFVLKVQNLISYRDFRCRIKGNMVPESLQALRHSNSRHDNKAPIICLHFFIIPVSFCIFFRGKNEIQQTNTWHPDAFNGSVRWRCLHSSPRWLAMLGSPGQACWGLWRFVCWSSTPQKCLNTQTIPIQYLNSHTATTTTTNHHEEQQQQQQQRQRGCCNVDCLDQLQNFSVSICNLICY